jgi:hypothetical protein
MAIEEIRIHLASLYAPTANPRSAGRLIHENELVQPARNSPSDPRDGGSPARSAGPCQGTSHAERTVVLAARQ